MIDNSQKKKMKNLKTKININIRFSETDAMGVVWHGNYLKFFEDAREFFGEKFGMSYLDVYNNGYYTPIVKSEINHKNPLYYGEKMIVEISLEFSKAAKIIHHYSVINQETNVVCATGKTIQVFMDAKTMNMELNLPEFYAKWIENVKTKN